MLSLWSTAGLEGAVMFMWMFHCGTATWHLYDSNCALYQGILMGGTVGSSDVPNTWHFLCKCASVTSQALGICGYMRRQNSSFVLSIVGILWKMRAVCVRNQLTKLQMEAKWGFPAVSQLCPQWQLCADSMVNSASFLWPLRNRGSQNLESKLDRINFFLSLGSRNGYFLKAEQSNVIAFFRLVLTAK